MRIDILVEQDKHPVVLIDGESLADRPLRQTDGLDQPHTLIWLDGVRQYDVEVRVNGRLDGVVPPKSVEVDAAYDVGEAAAS